MIIDGLQKLTLLDFPGKIACTVFTHGCNYRCPFCHNASLVVSQDNGHISEEEVFAFLEKRKGLIDGVAVTGGEPTLQKDLKDFIVKVKSMGYLVKLDTNGSNPDKLEELIEDGLLDYVAVDIKAPPEKYPLLTGVKDFDFTQINRTIELLKRDKVEYEFRTTVVNPLHEAGDFEKIAQLIKGCQHYFLQQFVDSGDIISEGMSAYDRETMEEFKNIVANTISCVELRGV